MADNGTGSGGTITTRRMRDKANMCVACVCGWLFCGLDILLVSLVLGVLVSLSIFCVE